MTRLFPIFAAALAVGALSGPPLAGADSPSRLSAAIAANKSTLSAVNADYAAVPAVQAAEQAADGCFRTASARAANLGDLDATELGALRECIAGAFAKMLARMERLKSLQRNATFDYALFAETSRLLADKKTPSKAAIAPFEAMLAAATAAAQHESERLVLARLKGLSQKISTDG